MVHASRGRLDPASDQLLSEVAIVTRLAERLVPGRRRVDWAGLRADYALIRDHIARVVPGFEDFNDAGAPPRRLRPAPPARDDRRCSPPRTGKAQFTGSPVTLAQVPEGRLLLQTLRSHDQYNTTIYGLDDRYRGIRGGRRVVFVNPEDARRSSASPTATYVDLVSEWHDGRSARRGLPGGRTTPPPGAAPPPTSPRPTCWCRWTRWRGCRTRLRRRASSCGSRRTVSQHRLKPSPRSVVTERVVALADGCRKPISPERATKSRPSWVCRAMPSKRVPRVRLEAIPMFSAVWLHSSFSICSWLPRDLGHALGRRRERVLELGVGNGLEDQADASRLGRGDLVAGEQVALRLLEADAGRPTSLWSAFPTPGTAGSRSWRPRRR